MWFAKTLQAYSSHVYWEILATKPPVRDSSVILLQSSRRGSQGPIEAQIISIAFGCAQCG